MLIRTVGNRVPVFGTQPVVMGSIIPNHTVSFNGKTIYNLV